MSLMDEFKKIIHPYDDEDYDYEEEEQQFPTQRSGRDSYDDRRDDRRSGSDDRRSSKVVNIHATTQIQVVLVKPKRYDNAAEIANHLRDKRTVVLNLEDTDENVARRLLDFLSGVAYAQEGEIKKVAKQTFLVTPFNVRFEGDLLDELENGKIFF